MKPWRRVDFGNLVREVRQPQWGKEELSVLSGHCTEGDLLEFVARWPLDRMPYRIWEYVSEIVFEQNTLPQNIVLLERGRLFGEGGDLEVRRDGTGFAWRFIGPAGTQAPGGNLGVQDYWYSCHVEPFCCREERALLWGRWNESRMCWYDDRVGAARLAYPADPGWQRVQIHYRTFSRAGRIEFVWYIRLSEWKEDDNG